MSTCTPANPRECALRYAARTVRCLLCPRGQGVMGMSVIPASWAPREALHRLMEACLGQGVVELPLERARERVNRELPEGEQLAYFDFVDLVAAEGFHVVNGSPKRLRFLGGT
jgi:hypothetical protein